jgi:hypothetical protein
MSTYGLNEKFSLNETTNFSILKYMSIRAIATGEQFRIDWMQYLLSRISFPSIHLSVYLSICKEFLINSPDRIETSINIHLVPMKSIHILIKLSFKISLSSDFFRSSWFYMMPCFSCVLLLTLPYMNNFFSFSFLFCELFFTYWAYGMGWLETEWLFWYGMK